MNMSSLKCTISLFMAMAATSMAYPIRAQMIELREINGKRITCVTPGSLWVEGFFLKAILLAFRFSEIG